MHLPSVSTQHRIDEWSWYRVGRISPLVLLCLTLCSLAIGCSQEDLEDLKKKTADLAGDAGTVLKDAADDAVGAGQDMAMAAKEMVDQDGQAEFTLDGKSYTTNAAMLHLMKFSDGRHGRLMIVSHPPMQSPDSFPAFVVQCDVTPDTQMVDMLKGQSLDAELFALPSANGKTYFNDSATKGKLTIDTIDRSNQGTVLVVGRVEMAGQALKNGAGETASLSSLSFDAVLASDGA